MAHASNTPEWADMYVDDTIISIEQYVCQRIAGREYFEAYARICLLGPKILG